MNYSKEKFLSKVIHLLDTDKTTENSDAVNFSCPFCHEGKSKGRKRRAYILKNEDYRFYCHNCSKAMNFEWFLKEMDSDIFRQYFVENKDLLMEQFLSKEPKQEKKKLKDDTEDNLVYMDFDHNFIKATAVNPAIEYIHKRKIPNKFWDDIWWYIGKEKTGYNNCIIFPMRRNGKIYGFTARSVFGKYFHIHLAHENNTKLYNYYNVNKNLECFITESIIDSLFVENSMAIQGVTISKKLLQDFYRPVFILDNDAEGTSHTGIIKSKELVKKGFEVFIMPKELNQYKDINELVMSGFPENKIMPLVRKNIYSGKEALIRLALN